MIDRKFIGTRTDPFSVEVEKNQLRFFAKSVGETNPIYTDETSAKAAGYRSLLAPPTFAFSLNLATPDPMGRYKEMGIDLGKVLHGEQKFEYFEPICAGDTITLEGEITDIYEKKGGTLEFIVTETRATNQGGETVAKMISTTVVRN